MTRSRAVFLRRTRVLAAAALVILVTASGTALAAGTLVGEETSISVGFAADTGGNSNTAAVLAAARTSGVSAFFNLGDLSYDPNTPETTWCALITKHAGRSMAYQLLAGNHEDQDGPDGIWSRFAGCLPDRLGSTGSYARQYYADYPASDPIARFIMVSPKLSFAEGGTYWSYEKGTQGYEFTTAAIDDARSAGIPFVVVGMHMYCLSMVNFPCYAETDLMNLLIAKKVDLYLQGHDHAYSRTKQLALKGSCSSISISAFSSACVANASPSSSYVSGAGTVLATVGAGGRSLNKQDPNKPVAPYFQTFMGTNNNPTYGFLKVDLTHRKLTGTFVRGAGGSFIDTFTITKPETRSASPTPAPTRTATDTPTPASPSTLPPTPTTTLTPVADSWVGADAPAATHGSEAALYVDGSPNKLTYLKYDLSSLAGATLTGAELRVTTTSGSNSGSPDTQVVRAVGDTGWSESALTYSTRPEVGAALSSVSSTSGAGTAYTIPLPVTTVQRNVGRALSLAIDGSGGDAFYIGSRESGTPPRLVLTRE